MVPRFAPLRSRHPRRTMRLQVQEPPPLLGIKLFSQPHYITSTRHDEQRCEFIIVTGPTPRLQSPSPLSRFQAHAGDPRMALSTTEFGEGWYETACHTLWSARSDDGYGTWDVILPAGSGIRREATLLTIKSKPISGTGRTPVSTPDADGDGKMKDCGSESGCFDDKARIKTKRMMTSTIP